MTEPVLTRMMGMQDKENFLSFIELKYLYQHVGLATAIIDAPCTLAESIERRFALSCENGQNFTKVVKDLWEQNNIYKEILQAKKWARLFGASVLLIHQGENNLHLPLDPKKDFKLKAYDPMMVSLFNNRLDAANINYNEIQVIKIRDITVHPSRWKVLQNDSPLFLTFNPATRAFTSLSELERARKIIENYITLLDSEAFAIRKISLIMVEHAETNVVNAAWKSTGTNLAEIINTTDNAVISLPKGSKMHEVSSSGIDSALRTFSDLLYKQAAQATKLPPKLLIGSTEGSSQDTEAELEGLMKFLAGFLRGIDSTAIWLEKFLIAKAIKTNLISEPYEYSDLDEDSQIIEVWRHWISEYIPEFAEYARLIMADKSRTVKDILLVSQAIDDKKWGIEAINSLRRFDISIPPSAQFEENDAEGLSLEGVNRASEKHEGVVKEKNQSPQEMQRKEIEGTRSSKELKT